MLGYLKERFKNIKTNRETQNEIKRKINARTRSYSSAQPFVQKQKGNITEQFMWLLQMPIYFQFIKDR